MQTLWICVAGGVGTGARYLLSSAIFAVVGLGFPWGTFAVNLLGSFAGGAAYPLAERLDVFPTELRLMVVTGFLGGFTTYSAFNTETVAFTLAGQWRMALAYVTTTVALCFCAGLAGATLCRRILM